MDTLRERDRQLVGLRVAGGLSYAEAGQVVGMREGAAKMATHRALERVRATAAGDDMSDRDDRDLAAAFDELRAPAVDGQLRGPRPRASRCPDLAARAGRRCSPPALAVAVALVGAGTFLALRSARQGGTASGSAGNPPARAGAAMAFDSTAGVTVMFGGTGSAGQALTDTWTWDGSAWHGAAAGPGALVGARMVDDPADGGVLLLGMTAPAPSGSGGGASGCSAAARRARRRRAPAPSGVVPASATGIPIYDSLTPAPPPRRRPSPRPRPTPPDRRDRAEPAAARPVRP